MSGSSIPANVYVDGFNLYYGCLKGTPFKWLDLHTLCTHLLPRHEIQRIRYFTARISGRANNPQSPARQEIYLRALGTLPTVSVHLGRFLTTQVRMPLARPRPTGPKTIEVIKTEEKGSDVNLATHLLLDAFRQDASVYVVVSNDSDLTEPIRIVRHELGYIVGILNPQSRPSRSLLRCQPNFFKQIRSGVLAKSQFPAELADAKGRITRPASW